jgi:glycosyltransferase involved in cell wall biosynthesis
MKIFAIMVVKNEVDIIAHTLRAASEWCDQIYVLDNGSDDGTWEVVEQMARENRAIVAHGRRIVAVETSPEYKRKNASITRILCHNSNLQ